MTTSRHISVLLTVLCVVAIAMLFGCDRPAASSGVASPIAQIAPRTAFFDGVDFISPAEWASSIDSDGPEASHAIGQLSLEIVGRKRQESQLFKDGIDAHPELDPVVHFENDLPIILSIGQARAVSISWAGDRGDEGIMDDLILPDGSRVRGVDLAAYFNTLELTAKAGLINQFETDHDIANALLWFGYRVYKSDSDPSSAKMRTMILGSTWRAAFEFRAQATGESKDLAAQATWIARQAELDATMMAVLRKALADRRKQVGEG